MLSYSISHFSLICFKLFKHSSFSTLSRVKNAIRASTSDERLNHLSIMCIESEVMQSIDFKDVISDFANAKARKVPL